MYMYCMLVYTETKISPSVQNEYVALINGVILILEEINNSNSIINYWNLWNQI